MQARARVETFSRWVERVSGARVAKEVEGAMEAGTGGEVGHLEAVMSHLTARQIYEACALLQQQGNGRYYSIVFNILLTR